MAAQVGFVNGVVSLSQVTARAFGGSLTGEATLEPAHLDRAHVTVRLRDVESVALETLGGVTPV